LGFLVVSVTSSLLFSTRQPVAFFRRFMSGRKYGYGSLPLRITSDAFGTCVVVHRSSGKGLSKRREKCLPPRCTLTPL
jgi:hypothetical protein